MQSNIRISRAVVPFGEPRGFWVSRSACHDRPPYHRAARRGGKDGAYRTTEREKSPRHLPHMFQDIRGPDYRTACAVRCRRHCGKDVLGSVCADKGSDGSVHSETVRWSLRGEMNSGVFFLGGVVCWVLCAFFKCFPCFLHVWYFWKLTKQLQVIRPSQFIILPVFISTSVSSGSASDDPCSLYLAGPGDNRHNEGLLYAQCLGAFWFSLSEFFLNPSVILPLFSQCSGELLGPSSHPNVLCSARAVVLSNQRRWAPSSLPRLALPAFSHSPPSIQVPTSLEYRNSQ